MAFLDNLLDAAIRRKKQDRAMDASEINAKQRSEWVKQIPGKQPQEPDEINKPQFDPISGHANWTIDAITGQRIPDRTPYTTAERERIDQYNRRMQAIEHEALQRAYADKRQKDKEGNWIDIIENTYSK